MRCTQATTFELFDLLRQACSLQFGFNPKQVSAWMHYMGPQGKDTHQFRDSDTHSQILLNRATGEATLVYRFEGRDYWDTAELVRYRKTDAELLAETHEEERLLNAVKESAFYLAHSAYLRTLYVDHPEYKDENPSPSDGALLLVQNAQAQGDPALVALSQVLGTADAEVLSDKLLDAIACAQWEEIYQCVRALPEYVQALAAFRAFRALPEGTPAQQAESAKKELARLTTAVCAGSSRQVFPSMVRYLLMCDA